jgi:hypothetical protein
MALTSRCVGWWWWAPTGIADTSAKMQHITELVQQHLPGIYVVALEVTGSKLGSIFTGSNKQVRTDRERWECIQCWLRLTIPRMVAAPAAQVEMICAALSADSKLAGGINVMGVSQVSSTCTSRPTHHTPHTTPHHTTHTTRYI